MALIVSDEVTGWRSWAGKGVGKGYLTPFPAKLASGEFAGLLVGRAVLASDSISGLGRAPALALRGATSGLLVNRPECLIVSGLVDKHEAASGDPLFFQPTYTRRAQVPMWRPAG
jgi:hypothetical protein